MFVPLGGLIIGREGDARMIKSAITRFVVLLLFICVPSLAHAEDYTWDDNGDGTCTITGYIGPGGDITIPNTLTGLTVIAIGDGAFYSSTNLNSVTIYGSVTTVGGYAFYYCNGLTNVVLGTNVTSLGSEVFYNCSSLAQVTILSDVTTIGPDVFSGCSSLTHITFGGSVTTVSGQWSLYLCTSLNTVTLGGSVASIEDYAFYSCTSPAT